MFCGFLKDDNQGCVYIIYPSIHLPFEPAKYTYIKVTVLSNLYYTNSLKKKRKFFLFCKILLKVINNTLHLHTITMAR